MPLQQQGPGLLYRSSYWRSYCKRTGTGIKEASDPCTYSRCYCLQYVGASGLICPIMDAKRCQVYTGLYHMENGIETVMEQCPMDMGELIEQLNKQSERVIFLGDGVPVYKAMIEEKMTAPYVFAPAQMNRQRASCVAALGMKALTEGYTGAKVQPADEFVPDYLRKSQAERQREAEASPDGQAGKLPGDY